MPFDDDPVADNQAESRASAALGCEEGHRKDVGPGFWRDSTAIVRDLNEKKLAVAPRADVDASRPADGAIKDMHDASFYAHLIVGFGATYDGTTLPLIGQQSGPP